MEGPLAPWPSGTIYERCEGKVERRLRAAVGGRLGGSHHSGLNKERALSGVFGFVSGEGGERCSRVVVEMGERMRHRPYQVVEVGSPRAGVGLGRIGIGIINRDRQPVCSGEGEVWVCLSGEFFHQEARREELVKRGALEGDAGDAEMALQVYLSGGAEGLTELEGEFVVVVWDGRSGELVLVNDRFGLYPHYIAHAGGGFVFAPEIKGVLCAPGLTEVEAAALFSGRGDARLRYLAFDSLRYELGRTSHYPPNRRVDHFRHENTVRRLEQYMVVFSRSAFEVRCPYLDYSLVSFFWTLEDSIRIGPALRRAMLTLRAPHLAMVPYDRDSLLPHSNRLIHGSHAFVQRGKVWFNRHLMAVFVGPKRPWLYADYENYLRAELKDWAEGIRFDRRTQDRGLFDPTAVRALWNRHLAGKELWTIGKIAPLISIELVLRSLYDGVPGGSLIPVSTEVEGCHRAPMLVPDR